MIPGPPRCPLRRSSLRPLAAAVTGFVAPGTGHLLGLRPGAGLVFFLAFLLLECLGGFLLLAWKPAFLPTLAGLLAWRLLAARAALGHARLPEGFQPRWFQRPPMVLAATALVAMATCWPSHGLGLFRYQILISVGRSMEPTLRHPDVVVVDTWWYRTRPVQPGDLLAFEPSAPIKGGGCLGKRCVATGGDWVEVRNRVLRVNDQERLRWSACPQAPPCGCPEVGPLLVPARRVFCMGDNPEFSQDSRHFGPVPDWAIQGRVLYGLGRPWSSARKHRSPRVPGGLRSRENRPRAATWRFPRERRPG